MEESAKGAEIAGYRHEQSNLTSITVVVEWTKERPTTKNDMRVRRRNMKSINVVTKIMAVVVFSFGLIVTPVAAQVFDSPILPGPNGGISKVVGGGEWREPILVYSDSNENVYIPSQRLYPGYGMDIKNVTLYTEYKNNGAREEALNRFFRVDMPRVPWGRKHLTPPPSKENARKIAAEQKQVRDRFCYLEEVTCFILKDNRMDCVVIQNRTIIDKSGRFMFWANGVNESIQLDSKAPKYSKIANNLAGIANKVIEDSRTQQQENRQRCVISCIEQQPVGPSWVYQRDLRCQKDCTLLYP